MKKYIALYIICFTTQLPLSASWLPESLFPRYNAHKAFEQKEYTKAQQILEKLQVENPNDPLLNYNLGTIYYKKKEYDAAKESFNRAATHAFASNKKLLEKSYFNLGNSFYKKGLALLGENWEKEKIDKTTLNQAIMEIQSALEKYKNTLKLTKANEQAEINKKTTEAILQKLVKKQEQQKQEQKQNEKKEQKQEQEQNQQQNQQQNQPDKEEKQKQSQEQQEKPKKKQQQKASPNQEKKPENMEERSIRVLLDQLQAEEKQLQKKLMKQKTKQDEKPRNSYQKPW